MKQRYHVCLSAAGSDPSGGAGVQADLKTFTALGCYGQAAVTALTVQNSEGVLRSEAVDGQLVYEQVVTAMRDLPPAAMKIGITPHVGCIHALARAIAEVRPPFVVLDPVMVSSSGLRLMDGEAVEALVGELIPLCSLVTPNLPEARVLAGGEEMPAAEMAEVLWRKLGGAAVLVKGGHSEGEPVDVLFDGKPMLFSGVRVDTPNSHGTGCVLSSAIAAFSARGCPLPEAVRRAKQFLTQALRCGADYYAGRGCGAMYLLPS